MGCGDLSPRQPFQEQLAQLNPEAAEAVRKIARAGPDAEAARRRSLRVGAGEPDNSRVGAAHAMLAAKFPILNPFFRSDLGDAEYRLCLLSPCCEGAGDGTRRSFSMSRIQVLECFSCAHGWQNAVWVPSC